VSNVFPGFLLGGGRPGINWISRVSTGRWESQVSTGFLGFLLVREGLVSTGFPGFLLEGEGPVSTGFPGFLLEGRRLGFNWIPRVSTGGGKASVSSAVAAENILTLGELQVSQDFLGRREHENPDNSGNYPLTPITGNLHSHHLELSKPRGFPNTISMGTIPIQLSLGLSRHGH
jgi:hypothetical protein